MTEHQLELHELADDYSVLRFDPSNRTPSPHPLVIPDRGGAAFLSVTSTDSELSVICATDSVDSAGGSEVPVDRSDGWRCLKITATSFPSETPGIIASVVGPLAEAAVSAFAVASFDTDHVLVQDVDIDVAHAALEAAGHLVVRSSPAG